MRTLKVFITLLLLFSTSLAEPTVEIESLEKGMGAQIKTGEAAVVTYRLELADGTFVEKAGLNAPFTFHIGAANIIPGLSEGVVGMKVGEKRVITIPPELGYGAEDLGKIPPNSTIRFDIELLEIGPMQAENPGEEGEDEGELSEKFQTEDFLNQRHAKEIEKPAMFEYLIRDFFTKPWRYEDGHLKIWRATGKIFGCFLLLCGLALLGRKKQWWIL